ncbi:3-isopropylmalate dehydratase, small subunit [Alkalispirochaeta americana]|uniref:3-isopropylmalate dehydratase n=1 Tax=Alkalispirochaeta americana TaxID=159291 RepID=A0A1N6P1N4_9SPIO|nr:3-isopropylmalate dehydratase small subunit [Alkalispirochaeta americana]SIP98052.1 3-isopropylmalate dehydratase, small subunit [Alkalispirochaeta americana]
MAEGEETMNEMKQAIKHVTGRAVVVRGNDIDTDQIIPARFMKVVTFDGLGQYAFYDLRYDEGGTTKPHPFNEERFSGAEILLANKNFGCGSSREHAPQALMRAGIRAIVGESFAEIFAGNCTALGVPAVTLESSAMAELMRCIEEDASLRVEMDLPAGEVRCGGKTFTFSMHPAYRSAFIAGSWDSTSVLLSHAEQIEDTARRLPYLAEFPA